MKNHYQTLGLTRNASHAEIKKAYRTLAMKFHPDKNINDDYYDNMFKEIKKAYDVLSDPIQKQRYDLDYNKFIELVI
mgnify:CR=1 FL=1